MVNNIEYDIKKNQKPSLTLPRTHFWTLMQLWGTQNKTRLFLNSIACIDYRIDVVNGFKSHGNHGTIIPFTRLRNTESFSVSLNCQSNSSKLHMQEALDGRLLDDPQHIVNTASGQPCLESYSAFIPGYLRHAIHYAALFSTRRNKWHWICLSVTNVKGPLRAGGCKSACSHFKLPRKGIKTATLRKRRSSGAKKKAASRWYAYPDGRVNERGCFLWS